MSLATFTVSGTRFGVPAELVQEVVDAPRLTRVPRAPELLAGLVNLRGRIVPVYSLAARMGLESHTTPVVVVLALAEPLAVAVEQYHEVLDVSGAVPGVAPSTLPGAVAECIARVWQLDGLLVCELDVERSLAVRP